MVRIATTKNRVNLPNGQEMNIITKFFSDDVGFSKSAANEINNK